MLMNQKANEVTITLGNVKVADEDLRADMLFTALNNEIAVLKDRITVIEAQNSNRNIK